MITIKYVYSDITDAEKIINSKLENIFLELIDEGSYKQKKIALKLKSSCGARLTPFVAVYDKDILIKAFYSEADDDIINSLIKYLHEYKSN